MPSSPNVGSLKERFGALRTLRPFIAMVWRTSPSLTVSSLVLRLVRALLPVVTLYIGKLIIDDVVQLVQMPDRPATLRGLAEERPAQLAGRAAAGRVRAGRPVRRAGPRRRAGRQPAVGAGDQRLERQPDGARRHPRSGGFRGRRVPGPARAGAPPDQRPPHPDVAAARPGAGHRDGRELRRRPAGLRAVADRAAAGGAAAGVPGRGAFQRPDLHARLRPHAGAARARLCAPDRGQRRDRQGSEDLRPEPLPDRSLQQPGRRLLRRQPPARAAARDLGRAVHRDRHHRLLLRLRLHRLAHAGGRVLDRRSHLPRRIVPRACAACSRGC